MSAPLPPKDASQAVAAFLKRLDQLDREKNDYDKLRDF